MPACEVYQQPGGDGLELRQASHVSHPLAWGKTGIIVHEVGADEEPGLFAVGSAKSAPARGWLLGPFAARHVMERLRVLCGGGHILYVELVQGLWGGLDCISLAVQ